MKWTEIYIYYHAPKVMLTSLPYVAIEFNRILIIWMFYRRSYSFTLPMTSFLIVPEEQKVVNIWMQGSVAHGSESER